MAETWDLVNEKGEKLDIIWPRSKHAEIPTGVYHPCVEVWVKIGDKLLITRRHPDKTHGLTYDVPGGAVICGETALMGAVRELFEEAGIACRQEQLTLIGEGPSGKAYAMSYLLKLHHIPEISLQPTEVVGYKLVGLDEFLGMSDEICPPTLRRFAKLRDKIF